MYMMNRICAVKILSIMFSLSNFGLVNAPVQLWKCGLACFVNSTSSIVGFLYGQILDDFVTN